jgi:uroporphyrin-III C-methyltransferase / precorrin-2 dehydrogenase / sirohydrochlorin ferrochelatase
VTAGSTLPLGLRVAGRRVAVVGGGPVALRRVSALVAAGADVLLVAPEVEPALGDLADRGALTHAARPYAPGDLDGAWLAYACTSDAAVNARVAAEAEDARVWCVRADDAAASTAWTPAHAHTGGLTVAVHAEGDPRRAVAAREACLATLEREPVAPVRRPASGRVVLVGGGPGDPGLVTVRGRDALATADVVVADRLAPLALLDGLPDHVEVVDAAKIPGGRAMRQEEINRRLVAEATAGRVVVRLKGGDPFVLGRGYEEVEACAAAGIPVEVVPGITSAVAVPGLAGVPVTHRGVSQGFAVASGHVPPGDPRSTVDWDALAASGLTLVLLMAVDTLGAIAGVLTAAGRDADTPVTVVRDGATSRQQAVRATLADAADRVAEAGLRPPAVVVVGDVAGLAS